MNQTNELTDIVNQTEVEQPKEKSGFRKAMEKYVAYPLMGLGALVAVAGTNVGNVNAAEAQAAEAHASTGSYQQQQQLPTDLYPRGHSAINEDNFLDTIKKESANGKMIWVQYRVEKHSERALRNGDKFWNDLKELYGDQVDGYITVVFPNGRSSFGRKVHGQTGENTYPSFILYDSQANELTRVQGPPDYKKEDVSKFFRFIDNDSRLKQNLY